MSLETGGEIRTSFKEEYTKDSETIDLVSYIFQAVEGLSPEDKERTRNAITLALYAHTGQFREGGGPYVNHVLRVGERIARGFSIKDADTICAAVLHDVVEDQAEKLATLIDKPTGNTAEDALLYIESYFGRRVASLVRAVTKPTNVPKPRSLEEKRDQYVEFAESVINNRDISAFYIKLSDFIDNTSNLTTMRNKKKQYALAKKYLPVFSLFIDRLYWNDITIPDRAVRKILTYLEQTQKAATEIIVAAENPETERRAGSTFTLSDLPQLNQAFT